MYQGRTERGVLRMIRANAIAELELYTAERGGRPKGLTVFPANLLARANKAYYGFDVLQGPFVGLSPGSVTTVQISFLDLPGAIQVFQPGEWIPVGEPTKERGRMRIKTFCDDDA